MYTRGGNRTHILSKEGTIIPRESLIVHEQKMRKELCNIADGVVVVVGGKDRGGGEGGGGRWGEKGERLNMGKEGRIGRMRKGGKWGGWRREVGRDEDGEMEEEKKELGENDEGGIRKEDRERRRLGKVGSEKKKKGSGERTIHDGPNTLIECRSDSLTGTPRSPCVQSVMK